MLVHGSTRIKVLYPLRESWGFRLSAGGTRHRTDGSEKSTEKAKQDETKQLQEQLLETLLTELGSMKDIHMGGFSESKEEQNLFDETAQ